MYSHCRYVGMMPIFNRFLFIADLFVKTEPKFSAMTSMKEFWNVSSIFVWLESNNLSCVVLEMFCWSISELN